MTAESLQAALVLGAASAGVALSGAMAPGPFLTVTITRTLRQGRLSAALMLVGHALLEGLLLVGFAFGLQNLLRQETVSAIIAVVGAGVLFWMAWDLGRGAIDGRIVTDLETAEQPEESRLGPIAHGALVSISNPYWTLWWATIGVTLAVKGLAIGPEGVVAFFIGHELGDIAWYALVILAVSSGRKLLTGRVYQIVIGICAAFLAFLGVTFAVSGLGHFL